MNRQMNTEDPVTLLQHDHTAILAQLRILDRVESKQQGITTVLKTLLRDCTVHFNREAILFHALDEKLNTGGRSFHPLIQDHRDLKKHVTSLIKQLTPIHGASKLPTATRHDLRELTKDFRAHIHHEEKVVFLLAETRLTKKTRLSVFRKMLET